LKLAKDRGIPCRQAVIRPEDIFKAEEVFLTNSLMGVMPVARIDGYKIGRRCPGAVTRKFMGDYGRAAYKL